MELISKTIDKCLKNKGSYGMSTIKGFTPTPNWILKSRDYNQSEKMVLTVLNSFAMQKKECWPSIKRIALRSSMGVTTAKKTIKSLTEKGIIEKDRGGIHKSNFYRLKY